MNNESKEHGMIEASYAALGRILVKFQYLERAISVLCHCMLTLPKNHSDIILSESSFKNKVQLTTLIARDVINNSDSDKEKDDLEKLKRLMQTALIYEEKRNLIFHSEWLEILSTKDRIIRTKTTAKIKKGLHKSFELHTDEGLSEIAKSFEILGDEILSFSEHLSIKLDRIHGSIMFDDITFKEPLNGIQEFYKQHLKSPRKR